MPGFTLNIVVRCCCQNDAYRFESGALSKRPSLSRSWSSDRRLRNAARQPAVGGPGAAGGPRRGRRSGADGGPQPGRRGPFRGGAPAPDPGRTPGGRDRCRAPVGRPGRRRAGLARRRGSVSGPAAAGRAGGGGAGPAVVIVALCCASGLALWPDRDALRRLRVTTVLGRRGPPWRAAVGRAVPLPSAVAAIAALGGAVVSTPLVAVLGGAAAFLGARTWLSA